MEKVKYFRSILLITAFFLKTIFSYAQTPPNGGPPTGGPNPPVILDENNSQPIIYAAIGLAVGVATYYILKKKPVKIPTVDYLHAVLLQENILPTADAIHLMYALNPQLINNVVVKNNQKLVKPDFPALPDTLTYRLSAQMLTANSVSSGLKEQVATIKATFKDFHRVRAAAKNSNLNENNLLSGLQTLENNIGFIEKISGELNAIKAQLLMDLLKAANQTLKKSIATKTFTEREGVLYQSISESLAELLAPAEPGKSSFNHKRSHDAKAAYEEGEKLYASTTSLEGAAIQGIQTDNAGIFETQAYLKETELATVSQPKENMLKGFAFAVYKMNAEGKPIMEGPEVEGQYFIQYVLPALKDYQEFYHNVSPPLATYASANLPPAKYIIIVRDSNFNPVTLQNPLIDTRGAFSNPQREHVDEKKEIIKVPIYIKP